MTRLTLSVPLKHCTLAFASLLVIAGCSSLTPDANTKQPAAESQPAQTGNTLSLRDIYASDRFQLEPVQPTRWLADGSGYTTLEDNESQSGKDIVRYHPKAKIRDVMVSAEALTPSGSTKPLSIADYQWSNDGNKVLIFTNTKRSWRTHTLGDYWVLDRNSGR